MKKLSAYELACGKVENLFFDKTHLFETKIELYVEHGAYHVRGFKHVVNSSSSTRLFWEVFDTLSEARFFIQAKKNELTGLNK